MEPLKRQFGTHNWGWRLARSVSAAVITAVSRLEVGGLPGWDAVEKAWKPEGDLLLECLVFGLWVLGAALTGLITSEKKPTTGLPR